MFANEKPRILKAPKREFNTLNIMSDEELISCEKGFCAVDVESYPNYFEVGFRCAITDKVFYFEMSPESTINLEKLRWVMFQFYTVGFNSLNYDLFMIFACLTGKFSTQALHNITEEIIVNKKRLKDLAIEYGVTVPHRYIRHIDLIEVAPLSASLKIYAGRLHAERLQDLPFENGSYLTKEQALDVLNYNLNSDLPATLLILNELKDQLNLRQFMSEKYNVNLMSKSDAQIAETIITNEVEKLAKSRLKKLSLPDDYFCQYVAPSYISFRSDILKQLLHSLTNCKFYLDGNGSPKMPKVQNGLICTTEELEEDDETGKTKKKEVLKIKINNTVYKIGIGGIHSSEKKAAFISDENNQLEDDDVESFYPRMILNNLWFPKQLTTHFLTVYRTIVEQRIAAKAAKDEITSDALKITINGSFGKFGSKWSMLYSPDLLLQVTITGQLSLLMLIEQLELAGIPVISANTDGIVTYVPKHLKETKEQILAWWRYVANFKTEQTLYKALYSRDVNNYIAVKTDGKCKFKGYFSNPWDDKKLKIFRFHKNPVHTIVSEAIAKLLTEQKPIEETILNCKDFKKFVVLRNVKGGGYKLHSRQIPAHTTKQELIALSGAIQTASGLYRMPGQSAAIAVDEEQAYLNSCQYFQNGRYGVYLGKAVRWYYRKGESSAIHYVGSSNKVATSEGAYPVMDLPKEFPTDIDYGRYIEIANACLYDIGYYKELEGFKLF